jgi:hypothetical protein
MSHPDSCYDPDNSYEDDDMAYNYDDYNGFHDEDSAGYHPDAEHEVASQFNENDEDEEWFDDYDDSMDGDHESGLASAGWGTDEDYGHYGDDIDSFHDYYGGEDY